MSGKICLKWRNYLTQGQASFSGKYGENARIKAC